MLPADLFRFCPRCAAARPAAHAGAAPLRCPACDLTFFFGPTVAAAAWVFDPHGRALLFRRAHEPAKGKLAIPGGFVDAGETADGALRREVREEVGLEVDGVAFLTSCPNRYLYRGVTYPVLDLIFTARAADPGAARALDGVAAVEWLLPEAVDPGELAFPSLVVSHERIRAGAGGFSRE